MVRVAAAGVRPGCPTGGSDLAWRSFRTDLKRRKPATSLAPETISPKRNERDRTTASHGSPRIHHVARYCETAGRKSQLVPCLTSTFANDNSSAGSPLKQTTEGRVMKRKLRKIAVVLTAAIPLAAAAIPTKAEAFGFLAPALV